MKKHLFATSAIVAAGVAVAMAPQNAAAQDDGGINLEVGGYYEFYYTFSEQDEPQGQNNDFRSDRVRQEGEIEFAGDAELDNGITVGVNVQLEAYSREAETVVNTPGGGFTTVTETNDQIDEAYAFVEGSFGRFEIGSHNSAPYLMHYTAPSVGTNVNSPDYIPFSTQSGIFPTTFAVGSSDANKLTYFSPRIAGFQVGASYAPDTFDTNGNSQSTGLLLDEDSGIDKGRAYGIGANFVRSFSGVDIAASVGYELVEDDDDTAPNVIGGNNVPRSGTGINNDEDTEQFSTGLNIGYAGFTVGGSYLNVSDDGFDRDQFDVGVGYSTGPWGASITWLYSDQNNDNAADAEQNYAVGSITYALGPGIKANANVHYLQEEVEQGGYDGDGYAGSLGLMLSF